MDLVESPKVELIAYPTIDWDVVREYLESVGPGASDWIDRVDNADISDGEALVEFGGRNCYRSWAPGLNPNVTRIREDSGEYLANLVKSQHGSVLEHANYSFIFSNVSRVFTHEMVRHRAGVAVSQESMRFVRLEDIPFWFPKWARDDNELMNRSIEVLQHLEQHQRWMARYFKLDDPGVPFSEKKAKTSFMRRFAPDGVATTMLCTINLRALRHIIYMRTALGAEEEIRLVFDRVANIVRHQCPDLLQDMHRTDDGEWVFDYPKI